MAAHEPILILNGEQISQKLNRLAYQVYEQNYGEKELLICGITERGYRLATLLGEVLKKISGMEVIYTKVLLDKENPRSADIRLDPPFTNLEGKTVILCDDVLYTGKTLAYAAIPFLDGHVRKLQCLVLIHRNHLTFPIQPSFIGMPLATTLQEHIDVNFDKGEVWLN